MIKTPVRLDSQNETILDVDGKEFANLLCADVGRYIDLKELGGHIVKCINAYERHEGLLAAAKDAICHDHTGSYAYNLLLDAIRICEPDFDEDENDRRFREECSSKLEAEIAACEEKDG